jgi:predicted transcriptional regulator
MDKKYQVFVSSTYEDLKEHRDQAVKTILRMGHLPVGMEMFNAADSTQWEIIKRHIDNSDYYIVVLAYRYGSIDPEDGISYTEKEYNYALEKGVPCLGFVIDSNISWPPSLVAKGDDIAKLDAFKAKIKSRMVSFWTSSDNLALHISAALSEVFNTKPRIGWVRSNEVMTSPIVAEELSRLSKKNEELTAQLAVSHKDLDETGQLLSLLKNDKIEIVDYPENEEITLLDVFLSACTQHRTHRSSAITRALLGVNYNDKEYREIIVLGLEELTRLGLLERHIDGSGDNPYYMTEKGRTVYAKYRVLQ